MGLGDPRRTPIRLPPSQRFLALNEGHSGKRCYPSLLKMSKGKFRKHWTGSACHPLTPHSLRFAWRMALFPLEMMVDPSGDFESNPGNGSGDCGSCVELGRRRPIDAQGVFYAQIQRGEESVIIEPGAGAGGNIRLFLGNLPRGWF
jgi:hypothetical protein